MTSKPQNFLSFLSSNVADEVSFLVLFNIGLYSLSYYTKIDATIIADSGGLVHFFHIRLRIRQFRSRCLYACYLHVSSVNTNSNRVPRTNTLSVIRLRQKVRTATSRGTTVAHKQLVKNVQKVHLFLAYTSHFNFIVVLHLY